MPKTMNTLSAWEQRQVAIGHDPADWQREYLNAIRCLACQGTGTGTGGLSGRSCEACVGKGVNPECVVEYLRNQAAAARTYNRLPLDAKLERTCGRCGGKGDGLTVVEGVRGHTRQGEMFCTNCGVTAAVAPDVLFALANIVRIAQDAVTVAEAGGALEDPTMRALAHMKSALVTLQQVSVRNDTHVALEGRL
jgi:RecJ-like exonuclease